MKFVVFLFLSLTAFQTFNCNASGYKRSYKDALLGDSNRTQEYKYELDPGSKDSLFWAATSEYPSCNSSNNSNNFSSSKKSSNYVKYLAVAVLAAACYYKKDLIKSELLKLKEKLPEVPLNKWLRSIVK